MQCVYLKFVWIDCVKTQLKADIDHDLYYPQLMNNPLIPEILSLLRDQPGGLSEYEIMQVFAEHEVFTALAEADQLALFQKHFITMNALYELQYQLWEDEQLFLEVSPLNIHIKRSSGDAMIAGLVISETEKLSEYYRDWNNFEHTNESDVSELLSSFWKKFAALDKREIAFEVLELEPEVAREDITESYRRLAAKHHPDKGGEAEMFIRIRQAYEILKINP